MMPRGLSFAGSNAGSPVAQDFVCVAERQS